MTTERGSWRSLVGKLALAFAAPVLVLALFEGGSSLLLAAWDFAHWRDPTITEAKHSRYDAELGWVSLPNVDIPDLYGPGVGLHTNARGFRGRAETDDSVPAGRRRAICSGDSFTLGYGVRDEETWCARLAEAFPDLETVNMGQGGYGFDQAYLWYQREGLPLQHEYQIFAYITDDFRRIPRTRFAGYGKPVLVVRNDTIVVTNVPAPERDAAWRMRTRATGVMRTTSLNAFFRRLLDSPNRTADSLARDSAVFEVAAAVIRELVETHRRRGSKLILVHLPVKADFDTPMSDRLRQRMAALAAKERVLFVDLVKTLGKLPGDSIASLYLLRDGHYSAAGHRWVAEQLQPVIRAAKGSDSIDR